MVGMAANPHDAHQAGCIVAPTKRPCFSNFTKITFSSGIERLSCERLKRKDDELPTTKQHLISSAGMVVFKLSRRPQVQRNEMEIAMKQHDITKICADSLRSFLNDKHGIKLGASHAHELVAAFLGYQSRAAMLADTKCPIANLEEAEFILLNPPTPFVDQRLKSLEGLSPDLPSSAILAEGVYAPIVAEKRFLDKIWPTFHDLAITLAEDRGHEKLRMLGINPKDMNWITDVGMETTEAAVMMTVTFDYSTNKGERFRQSKVEIKLPRIAGNIGYGKSEDVPAFYSGQARDPDFRLKHGIA